jgi:hypothetical protein
MKITADTRAASSVEMFPELLTSLPVVRVDAL